MSKEVFFVSDSSDEKKFHLLKTLKSTVEWLLSSCSSNIWNTYGSLPRLHSILDEILSHELRYPSPAKYWHVISSLSKLCPEVISPLSLGPATCGAAAAAEHSIVHSWLQNSLLEHRLSNQLKVLIQNPSQLAYHYSESAFLSDKSCVDVLLKCLIAVEQNQPILLTKLDPNLAIRPLTTNEIIVPRKPIVTKDAIISSSLTRDETFGNVTETLHDGSHSSNPKIQSPKRCKYKTHKQNQRLQTTLSKPLNIPCEASFVANEVVIPRESDNCDILENPMFLEGPVYGVGMSEDCSDENETCKLAESLTYETVGFGDTVNVKDYHRLKFKSLPNLATTCFSQLDCNNKVSAKCRSCTDLDGTSALKDSVPLTSICKGSTKKLSSQTWGTQHSRSKSVGTGISGLANDLESSFESALSVSLPNVLPGPEQQRKKSIFEGDKVNVPTECFFPRPQPGQTLTNFLQSNDFNICAELDRENAHFCISEALISAIEQIKCTQTLKFVEDEAESDEEIKKLTQRIRIRRREKFQEKYMKNMNLLSDGKTDTTTSISVSPKSSSSYSSEFDAAESIGSEDDIDDVELTETVMSNLTSMKESGLSLSMASMYSDADLHKMSTLSLAMHTPLPPSAEEVIETKVPVFAASTGGNGQMSAEAVALSLLRRFSDKQLPKASELEWLVSEQDAPQRLLPLPDSWPISPDVIEEEYDLEKTRLRGNLEWAPPRRQIISIILPYPNRKSAIVKQNYRCAGCGMKIDQSHIKKFRYCDYLGKFFCHCCHCNDTSLIPARIVWKWDFRKYYVSKFTWSILDQMYYDPLFNIADININLYKKVRYLDTCREMRLKMFYLRDFIWTCRNTKHMQKEIEEYPHHFFNEPHVYSINDLVQVKNGDLSKQLTCFVAKCTTHVMRCVLCQAKGFICEICSNNSSVIFPFQVTKVHRCNECGCCFHKKCFKVGTCPKCARIRLRKRLREQRTVTNSDEEM